MPPDPIDQAIADSERVTEHRTVLKYALPGGRLIGLDVPSDLSLDEFRALVGWVAADMPRAMAAGASSPTEIVARRPTLIVPKH